MLICIACFLALKFMIRRVWYRAEHLRPGFIRHPTILHTVDLFANLFFVTAVILMLNTHRWLLTILLTAALVGYDFALLQFYLYREARRILTKAPTWSLASAKQRVKDRIKREMP